MIIQGAAAMLIGQSLVQLAVGKDFPLEERFEVEPTEPLTVRRILAALYSSQAGNEAAASLHRWIFGTHGASRAQEPHHGVESSRRQGTWRSFGSKEFLLAPLPDGSPFSFR